MPERSLADMELETAAMNPSGNYRPQGTTDIKSDRSKVAKNTTKSDEERYAEQPFNAFMGDVVRAGGAASLGVGAPLAIATGIELGAPIIGAGLAGGLVGTAISRGTGLDDYIAKNVLNASVPKSSPAATEEEIQKATEERHKRELQRFGRKL